MSNKTSDNNVGSIEEDVDELKSIMNLRTVSGFAYSQKNTLSLQKAIKNVLTDYTRQKQINEEHQKINGELREKVKELEEENKELMSEYHNRIQEKIDLEQDFKILEQKIIDKIKDNNQMLDETNDGDIRKRLYIENEILQELLEGERK